MDKQDNSSCDPPFSKHQIWYILLIYGSFGSASFIVCLIGIILVVSLKLYRQFVYRLAMYQISGALFFGFAQSLHLTLLGVNENDESDAQKYFCKALAYVAVLTSWVKLLVTIWITVHLFTFTVFLKNWKKLEKLYIVLSLALPPLIASIPLFTDSYGHAGAWCWITLRDNVCSDKGIRVGEIEQFAVWFGPALLALLVNSVLFLVTIVVVIFRIRLKSWGRNQELLLQTGNCKEKQEKILFLLIPLFAYPLIFCLLITLPMISRLHDAVTGQQSLGLYVLSAVSIPSQGIAAGFALIFHVLCVECHKKMSNHSSIRNRKCQTDNKSIQQHNRIEFKKWNGKEHEPNSWTTVHVIPRESEIDKLTMKDGEPSACM